MPVVLPVETAWGRHIYHLFQVRVQQREKLMAYLKDNGIGTEIYYPVPLHLQKCFEEMGYRPGSMPNAEQAAQQTLALPVYPELTDEQLEYVVRVIKEYDSWSGE
jgi:dTDP-4-amino-4,6-dideoxygalactose transaminase